MFSQDELEILENSLRYELSHFLEVPGFDKSKHENLIQKVTSLYEGNKNTYADQLKKAQELAYQKHVVENQQKYGGQPYTHHLKTVSEVLVRFGFHPNRDTQSKRLQIAAWLHDIVEDTDYSRAELRNDFGQEVANIVIAVTNEKEMRDPITGKIHPCKNRKEKHVATYPKIAALQDATILKLADRIANIEASVISFFNVNEKPIIQMYMKEHRNFKRALYKKNDSTDGMWKHIDRLLQEPVYAFCMVGKDFDEYHITNYKNLMLEDGDPELGIPYPKIEPRENVGNEILCDQCLMESL